MEKSISHPKIPHPPSRRLRAFAIDPSLTREIATSEFNEVTILLPWEDNLTVGPVDEYLEVVDFDPASQAFYPPVNLDEAYLLAQDGLTPSESNPQFHQQMVYAVARTTIRHFENALGRKALWSPHIVKEENKRVYKPVDRLRIYPHAMREANAYYSPDKKALLFGYFPASLSDPGDALPGEPIFTCLSQDIVAHETTHALLDGLHRRFIEPSNGDTWALHEGFADIVALFQHFTYPEVLKTQIASTRGSLEQQNILGQLAFQFGQATGLHGALRSAIGHFDKDTGTWVPEKADPNKILQTTEPHARGAILVAAVFEAFLAIYKTRTADLLRIASGGTGILPAGELHPDLVNRLAKEAAKAAGHVLSMCIRAMDYMAPVDPDFGDFLRALITADFDMVAEDTHNYRLAVIEAFRARGIYPDDVRNLNMESLLWHAPDDEEQEAFRKVFRDPARLHELVPSWELFTNRQAIFENTQKSQGILHGWLLEESACDAAQAARLVLNKDTPGAYYRDKTGVPTLEVHSVRPARRLGPNGQTVTDLVIEMTQRRRGYLDPAVQEKADSGSGTPPPEDFIFRGGCTLLVDPNSAEVRYCIYKRIESQNRLERMRKYVQGDGTPSMRAVYFGDPRQVYFQHLTGSGQASGEQMGMEPFALLHRSSGTKEVD